MKYTSKLMQEIIKSEEAKKILDYVSPIYENSYLGLWLFEVIGQELDDLNQVVDSFEQQVVPQTATWALQYFEAQYGIPTNESLPIQQRRDAIILKIKTRAPMNPAKMADIIKTAIGADVRIEENVAKNTFAIIVSDTPNETEKMKIREVVDKSKPAHLIYRIEFEQHTNGNIYYGGVFAVGKELTMVQVYKIGFEQYTTSGMYYGGIFTFGKNLTIVQVN